jgi:hypothetical protein
MDDDDDDDDDDATVSSSFNNGPYQNEFRRRSLYALVSN